MKLPEKISIGGKEYTIKKKRLLFRGYQGQICSLDNTLIVKKGMPEIDEEETFFHEIAHGLINELKYNYPKISFFERNEKLTEELGLMLRKIFKDLVKEQEEKQEKK